MKKVEKGEIRSFDVLLRLLRTLGQLEVLLPLVEEQQLSPSEYYELVNKAEAHQRKRASGKISNTGNQKAGKAFVKSAVADYESKKGTWQKRYNARLEAEKQAENYIYESIKANHPTAVNFLNQLKKDHEQDYKYLYKIKRIGDTSFALQFVTYDMKPKCDIYISYFTAEPNNCGHQVDKIVTY